MLVSSTYPTFFRLQNLNLGDNELPDYEITWSISPDVVEEAKSVLQDNKQLRIEGGNWQPNTEYTCTATISHKLLPQLFTFQNSTSFKLDQAPYGGVVSTYPSEGYVNDKITLYVYSWETPNDPVHYLVFETNDLEGTQRGALLTPEPLPQNKTFTFRLQRNPILVVIVDHIGEATTKVVKLTVKGGGRLLSAPEVP